MYQEKYNKEPDTFAAHTWDALGQVVAALKAVGPDKAKIRDFLENLKDWPGQNGVFNRSPKDHVGVGLGLLRDGRGQGREVEASPEVSTREGGVHVCTSLPPGLSRSFRLPETRPSMHPASGPIPMSRMPGCRYGAAAITAKCIRCGPLRSCRIPNKRKCLQWMT